MIPKLDRKEAVYLGVWPLPGSNEIEVAGRLKAEMERLRPTLPKDIDMRLVWDGTRFMTEALEEITKTLGETILIVAFVVFLLVWKEEEPYVPMDQLIEAPGGILRLPEGQARVVATARYGLLAS